MNQAIHRLFSQASPFWPQLTPNLLYRSGIYAFLFFVTHSLAAHWGGPQFFSMWYPMAGVRFAALWLWGPSWLIPMLVVELAVQYGAGFVVTDQGMVGQLVSVLRAPLCYAIAVLGVQRLREPLARDRSHPMRLAGAAILAPTLVAFAVVGWGWLRPDLPPFVGGMDPLIMANAFMLGDLLGIILVAPPLLWLYRRVEGGVSTLHRSMPTAPQMAEISAIFLAGCALAILFLRIDPSISLMPITLSISWIGLRYGRLAAWAALMASAAAILLWSLRTEVIADRFEFHIAIATSAIAAFLAGSFSDEQWMLQNEIARRDRILFQAERLKSIKAMSLAVIHDVSQPLSTLSLETQHLVDVSQQHPLDSREVGGSAQLIQRKVHNLAEMVQRMRRFGGRESDEPALCSLNYILKDAVELLRHEQDKGGGGIRITEQSEDIFISGYSVELTQAFYNFLHNALQSAQKGGVTVDVAVRDAVVTVSIQNPVLKKAPHGNGFGIGFHIARTIIEAHYGQVTLDNRREEFRTLITLPQADYHGG